MLLEAFCSEYQLPVVLHSAAGEILSSKQSGSNSSRCFNSGAGYFGSLSGYYG